MSQICSTTFKQVILLNKHQTPSSKRKKGEKKTFKVWREVLFIDSDVAQNSVKTPRRDLENDITITSSTSEAGVGPNEHFRYYYYNKSSSHLFSITDDNETVNITQGNAHSVDFR